MMKTIGVVVPDGTPFMGLAALSVFELATVLLTGSGLRADSGGGYRCVLLSATGGPVRTSLGSRLETDALPAGDGPDWPYDTTLVLGGLMPQPGPPPVLAHLRAAARRSRRVAGLCTGAFLLAEAGLLDGRRATTHWYYAPQLRQTYPGVRVEDDRIFIRDGAVWTSAGMSAGIDLALALLEDDHGPALSRAVAQRMVVYHRRPGGQSQFSALLEMEPRSDRVRRALQHARDHLHTPLGVEDLAAAASLSPRQFSRVFREETGQSPAKAVEHLRLESARGLLEQGRRSLDEVARITGFSDRDHMRRAFLRHFGHPPQTLRRSLHGSLTADADPDAGADPAAA
ncbi:GlxA family transcriptional regulator [Novispirillum itersonii]|nr:GlxA family transcriptional regulator [Novispirillum itersonii]